MLCFFKKFPQFALLSAGVALAVPALAAESAVPLPVPEQRPDAGSVQIPEAEMKSDGEEAQPMAAPAPPSPAEVASFNACTAELEKLGVAFEKLEPVTGENGCGIALPVAVKTLPGGIAFGPDSQLQCEAALALAKWTTESVLPAAKQLYPEASLQAIRHASTYVCRTRNSQTGAKISEHGRGNAIDIASFTFSNGKRLEVKPRNREADMEEAFQRAVRFGGCLYFTTVIGPYSDPFHADHLHFDMAERNRGYRLCRLPEMHVESQTDAN